MIIQLERWADALPELVPLFAEHWSEVETHDDEEILNPNWKAYLSLDDSGAYVLCIARIDGEIVGYIGDVIHENIHYQKLHAVNDFMYVKPEYRKSEVFPKMLRFVEQHEKKMGCTVRIMHLKRKGKDYKHYKSHEAVMRKVLGD